MKRAGPELRRGLILRLEIPEESVNEGKTLLPRWMGGVALPRVQPHLREQFPIFHEPGDPFRPSAGIPRRNVKSGFSVPDHFPGRPGVGGDGRETEAHVLKVDHSEPLGSRGDCQHLAVEKTGVRFLFV